MLKNEYLFAKIGFDIAVLFRGSGGDSPLPSFLKIIRNDEATDTNREDYTELASRAPRTSPLKFDMIELESERN